MHFMTNSKKLFIWLIEPEPRECKAGYMYSVTYLFTPFQGIAQT